MDAGGMNLAAGTDARFLGLALELAAKGEGLTRPNPMVGAVVVRDGSVVGSGFHLRAGTEHAEIVALAEAGARAPGATLYTTLEPCSHHGRTPPCTDRILAAGISRVVVGARDPNPLVNGRGMEILRGAGVELSTGILQEECLHVNRAFFSLVGRGRPWVTVKAACSLDGRIAAAGGNARWVSGEESRHEAMRLRARHDAVLVGVNTVIADDPHLGLRPPAPVRPILRAVLDSTLRTPPQSRLLSSGPAGPVILYHAASASRLRAEDLARGGAILVETGSGPRVNLAEVLADFARREVMSLLVEGGGETIGAFLRERLVDEVRLFLAPSLLGEKGLPLASGWSADGCGGALRLSGTTIRRLGADFLLEGQVAAPAAEGGSCSPD